MITYAFAQLGLKRWSSTASPSFSTCKGHLFGGPSNDRSDQYDTGDSGWI